MAERTWDGDDPRRVLLCDSLALIEDLTDLEGGRSGNQEPAVRAGRAVCALTDHLLFAFNIPGGDGPAALEDYAVCRQAVATISRCLDPPVEETAR